MKCDKCKRVLANTHYELDDGITLQYFCPICALGKKEGSQSKYWETGTGKNAGHPEGFRYSDDTAKYKYNWDSNKKKWLDKNGKERPIVEPEQ